MNAAEIFRNLKKRIIIFDTETTGINPGNICQLSYLKISPTGIIPKNFFFKVDYIEPGAQKVHGLTVEKLIELSDGKVFSDSVEEIYRDFMTVDLLVGHNIDFDMKFLTAELERSTLNFNKKDIFCTMKKFTGICKIPKSNGAGFKWPNLGELSKFLNISQKEQDELAKRLYGVESVAHDARGDIICTYLCFLEGLKEHKILAPLPN